MPLFQFSDYFLLRSPLFHSTIATDLLKMEDVQDMEAKLRYLYQDERLKEALFLASPAFFKEVEKWLDYQKESSTKMIISLIKYTVRMSTRSTPFGLFAGVSLGNFTTTEGISLVRNNVNKPILKLDAPILVEVIEQLLKDPTIYTQLDYRINPTIYLDGKYYKYYQKVTVANKNQCILKKVRSTPILDHILQHFERNKPSAHYQSLVELLVNIGASIDQSNLFINNLIKLGIISSELQPNVIGSSYLDALINTIQKLDAQTSYLTTLLAVKTLLESSNPIVQIQDEIIQLLQPLLPGSALNNSVQADLLIGMTQNSLSNTALNHIRDQFQDLLPLSNPVDLADFTRFKAEFIKKYEDRMIPLTVALDPDIGVGYGNQKGVYNVTDEILGEAKNMTSSTGITNRNHHYQNLVIEKFVASIKNQFSEIRLTAEDLTEISERRTEPASTTPPSFYAIGNLMRRANQEKLFFNLGSIGGSSSGNLMSRFSHLDIRLDEKLKTAAQREQQLLPNVLLAEICHYPDNAAGNIIHRPAIRETTICVTATMDHDQQQIDVNDLYLFVQDQQLVLWSKKFDKMVMPRLTTAHNFEYGMNLYKFLADFQFQTNSLNISWNWGILKEQPRLPRITYENIVLSRAQWRIQKVMKYPDEPDIFVKNLKTQLEIPTWVVICSGDNELLINLDNPFCAELLMEHICKRDTILREYLLNEFSSVVSDSDNNIFANEIIIPIHTQTTTNNTDKVAPQESELKRCFPLGSEWLYAKIYCGQHFADHLLMETIPLIIATIRKHGYLKKWFFIRYNDPDPHIRIRIELYDPAQCPGVISIINKLLVQFVENGQIATLSFDTYIREIERYTPLCMELSEELFYKQSEVVLRTMQQSPTINDRWRSAFEHIDLLLESAKFTLIEKKEFCQQMNTHYQQEFGNNKKLWIHLNNKFQEKKAWFDKPFGHLFAPNQQLFNLQQNIFSTVRTNINENRSSFVVTSLLASYVHMFINRLFMSDQRLHELAIYHFMVSYYKMQIGKRKKAGHQVT